MGFEDVLIYSENKKSCASFSPKQGGLMTTLSLANPQNPAESRQLLYTPKQMVSPYKISQGLPLCFPICGRLDREGRNEYLYEQQRYAMGIHGFAYAFPWTVQEHFGNQITLSFQANPKTRLMYPFEFEVILNYQLFEHSVLCHQIYRNLGASSMPFYAGFHPYFWIDEARYSKREVLFSASANTRLIYNDTYSDVVGKTQAFSMPISIADPLVNESLLQFEKPPYLANLHFPDKTTLTIEAGGLLGKNLFPYFQLYHKAGSPFFCIEPWMAPPNSLNTKTALVVLEPQSEVTATLRISLN